MQHVRAISFDGDDTLWDFRRVMRHSLEFVLAELRAAYPVAAAGVTVDTMIAIRDQIEREWAGTGPRLEEIRTESFRRTLRSVGVDDDAFALRLNETYFAHRYADMELYDDVLPTFEALQTRYPLGLLTSGNSYPERCGLEGWFAFTVFAQDHGVEKPDPHLFHVASAQAGCDPRCIVHVGDSLEKDVQGACAAGMTSVWLNRRCTPNTTGIQPHFEIHSLREMPALLALGAR